MSRQFFHFRQFSVEHTHSAMKVGTDGVLVGALATVNAPQRILDVGTGTGLIALILAQRTQKYASQIDAVEIDAASIDEAKRNFAASNWKDRLRVIPQSIQELAEESDGKPDVSYDLIVCNPPYFAGSIPADASRAKARHATSLPANEFMLGARRLLSESGVLSVILPSESREAFLKAANDHSLHLQREVTIFPRPELPAKRIVVEFGREKTSTNKVRNESLVIQFRPHEFTEEYWQLTSPFYLERTFRRM